MVDGNISILRHVGRAGPACTVPGISAQYATHSPESRVGECYVRDARSGHVRAIFMAAGGLCPGATGVEWLSAPLSALQNAEVTNYNATIRHSMTAVIVSIASDLTQSLTEDPTSAPHSALPVCSMPGTPGRSYRQFGQSFGQSFGQLPSTMPQCALALLPITVEVPIEGSEA
jgi:hypothetical protein